jgi:MFS family permease
MNKDLLLIAFALMTWGVGESMFIYFQPLYLQQLGASPVAIGTILGFFGAAMAVAHIPAGYISDRFGRRPLLWASWVIGTVLQSWRGYVSSWFIAGMFLYGLTSFDVTSEIT